MRSKYGKSGCPCCGCLTIPTSDRNSICAGYICPVCYWEIDIFISSENEQSDQNGGLTLAQAQLNYRSFGACDEKMLQYVRRPYDSEKEVMKESNKKLRLYGT